MYCGSWKIDDLLTFTVITTRFDTGAATDADSAPSYRVYEDETSTPILTGTMALLDSSNTAGFYSEQITLSAANGFEKGKSYNIYIQATVNSVVGATTRNLQIEAEVDANRINWGNVDNPTTMVGLSGTTVKTATDVETDTQDIQSRLPATLGANGNIKADVRDYNGSAGTFSGGRPEVNTTHAAGTAWNSGAIGPNTLASDTITDAKVASDVTIASVTGAVGSVTAGVTLADDAITAGKFDESTAFPVKSADTGSTQIARVGADGDTLETLSDQIDTVATSTALATLAGKFAGITLVAEWLGLIAGKQTGNSTARTELRATGAGSGTYDETTDSQEAIRDRGDSAWTTAIGFSTHSASDVWAVATRTLTAFDSSFKTGYALSSAGVQAIWDALTSALTTVGSIGKLLVDNVNATISSRSTLTAAQVRTELSTELGRIDVATSTRASQASVDDLPTNAELATALGTADDAVLAAIAGLNNLSQANVRTAVGLASANLDTQLDALPTAAENADTLLGRNLAGGSSGGRMVKDALRFNRNRFTIIGTTLTVYEEDDSTIAWTAEITKTAGDPVSASDPA